MSPLRRAGFSAAASAPGCRAASEGSSGSRGRGERLLLLPQGRRGCGRALLPSPPRPRVAGVRSVSHRPRDVCVVTCESVWMRFQRTALLYSGRGEGSRDGRCCLSGSENAGRASAGWGAAGRGRPPPWVAWVALGKVPLTERRSGQRSGSHTAGRRPGRGSGRRHGCGVKPPRVFRVPSSAHVRAGPSALLGGWGRTQRPVAAPGDAGIVSRCVRPGRSLCADGVGEGLRGDRHADPAVGERRQAVPPLLAG